MIVEEWRTVVGFEEIYEISNMGRLRSLGRLCTSQTGRPRYCDGKVLRPRINKLGYLQTNLFREGRSKTVLIHRIVAIAFIPNPTNLPMVNHIDGKKAHCWETNLEWVDDKANKQHAIDIGRITMFKKLLTTEEVAEIRVIGKSMTQAEIARRFGTTQTNVSLILTGKHHKAMVGGLVH